MLESMSPFMIKLSALYNNCLSSPHRLGRICEMLGVHLSFDIWRLFVGDNIEISMISRQGCFRVLIVKDKGFIQRIFCDS